MGILELRFHLVNSTNPHRHCSPGADCKHKHLCQASTGPLTICCSSSPSHCWLLPTYDPQLFLFGYPFNLLSASRFWLPVGRCMHAKLLQLCPTLSHGLQPTRLLCPWILQARMLKWVAMPSLPGDLPDTGSEPASVMSPALVGEFFTTSTTWEALSSYPHLTISPPLFWYHL